MKKDRPTKRAVILKLGKYFLGKPTVFISSGTDKISIPIECPSAFPVMQYRTTLTIEAGAGYGTTWLKEVLGIEDFDVIDTGIDRKGHKK